MSRVDWDDEEPWNNAGLMYDWNRRRSLVGKRGKAALQELREVLEALPRKRLVASALVTSDQDVCLVGAYAHAKGVGMEPARFDEWGDPDRDPEDEYRETIRAGAQAGLSKSLASALCIVNDDRFCELSPEERYIAALKWIDYTLAQTDPNEVRL